MIARGAMLGPDQPVILHMLDIEPAKTVSAAGVCCAVLCVYVAYGQG
jgi:tRNA A58 N-methylase Trm61